VIYIGTGDLPRNSTGHASIDDVVRSVDQATLDKYRGRIPENGIPIQFAWYPFGGKNSRKGRKLGLPQDFLIFNASQAAGGWSVNLAGPGSPAVTPFASAPTLIALPDRIRESARRQWPQLTGADLPGMIVWGKTLTEAGLTAEDRTQSR
jgi:hypothetical protein